MSCETQCVRKGFLPSKLAPRTRHNRKFCKVPRLDFRLAKRYITLFTSLLPHSHILYTRLASLQIVQKVVGTIHSVGVSSGFSLQIPGCCCAFFIVLVFISLTRFIIAHQMRPSLVWLSKSLKTSPIFVSSVFYVTSAAAALHPQGINPSGKSAACRVMADHGSHVHRLASACD